MRVFFKKMGIENIRFKPAYNPYTEVSFLYRRRGDELKRSSFSLLSKFSPSILYLRNG